MKTLLEQNKTLEREQWLQFSSRALAHFCSKLNEPQLSLECASSNGKIEFLIEKHTLEKDISPDAAVGASGFTDGELKF